MAITMPPTTTIMSGSMIEVAYSLSGLFDPHTEVGKEITDLFANRLALLKRAYFAALKAQEHV
jgi:hypothetical protein